jgi:hypothetical protein
MVGEFPKRGLSRWGKHNKSKELLDLAGLGVLRVEREVQEDSFTGLSVFLGWCWPSKDMASILDIVLRANKDWSQESRRETTSDKTGEEETQLLTLFLGILD